MTKDEVAAAFEEVATLLELKGETVFRVNAYRNAARSLQQLDGDLSQLVADKKLTSVKGLGEKLRDHVTALVTTGSLPYLQELRGATPPGQFVMMRIPGLGPKKIKALADEMNITDIEALRRACEAGEVAKLKGFGAKTQQKILDGVAFVDQVGDRVRFDKAIRLGERLLGQLASLPGVVRSALCGSLRRRRETAKDIDILLSADGPRPIMDAFVALPEVMQVTGHGDTKSSVIAALPLGVEQVILNADLRVVSDEQFPYALVHFTGSKDHNKQLRRLAQGRGWTLNEYELAGGPACQTEEDIYEALGLKWMPPEMREDTGEVDLASSGGIPALIEVGDIRGVFHNHTTYSDGKATLAEMAEAARALGFEYFGVGDHSQSLTVANGLSPAAVRKQFAEVDQLNAGFGDGFRILKGIECDILADGSLDYDDDLLAEFDYVVVSVHTRFDMPIEEMTARVCKALAHPAATMLGHATGRLLLRRDGYKIDLDAVLKTAAEHEKMIEINAQPSRLDLDWAHCKRAKAMGIPLVINPDAHSPAELEHYVFGVNVARRAWLTKGDVFNTQGLADVRAAFGRG